MTLSEELVWRDSIKDHTFLDVNFLDQTHKVYLGIDPSADSLTIGNLAALVFILRLLKNGYEVFILLGIDLSISSISSLLISFKLILLVNI